jgi:hypothetical protein
MAPDVTYVLDEDAFTRYEALLAAHGIRVFPKTRETFESLDNPERSIITINGVLQHEGRDFRFTIRSAGTCLIPQRPSPGPSFHLYVVDQKDSEARLAIMDAVERAFPQPKRDLQPTHQPKRRIEPRTLVTNFGCLFFVAFIVLICILAVIGVHSLFR